MTNSDDLIALIDLGNQREIAIRQPSRRGLCFHAGSRPLRPAPSAGMRAATGAISYVSLAGSEMKTTVIATLSHAVYAAAALWMRWRRLDNGSHSPLGRIANGTKSFRWRSPLCVGQRR